MTTDHPVEAQANSSPLTSEIGRGHSIRCWLIMIVCLVLGLWGVYDYVWAIPMQARHAEQRELSQNVKELLESSNNSNFNTELRDLTILEINDKIENLSLPDKVTSRPIGVTQNEEWNLTLLIYLHGLESGPLPTGAPSDQMRLAGQMADQMLTRYGDAQAPSAYDRPVQWLFIVSLVFIPFYAWSLLTHSPRKYRHDEDGTLHHPEGAWSRDEIAGIDMSRWMSKSTAWVEHVDGTRVKLDAHIFKDLHLIIGAIAHRFHPDKWEEDGRKIKPENSPESPSDEEQDS
ncbi:MAG: hypothetical protein P8K80_01255 [Phycisphaerales bacterium]|nr:hypothetical protein [Phycisphaerales bacterium]